MLSDSIEGLFDDLLEAAVLQKASDIHIEPIETQYRIRFRILGMLRTYRTLEQSIATRVLMRIKVLAGLDTAEKRLPQDGSLRKMIQESWFDFRVNFMPLFLHEKCVLRILGLNKLLTLNQLNMPKTIHQQLMNALHNPSGLILITGATGSGKTTTLFAILDYLNQEEKNISTIEDPVELRLPGINQISLHPKLGLSTEVLLRALLRQDPDVIMLGEIRDVETAKMACRAALSGHLMLASLHANSAQQTLQRLHSLKLDPKDLAQIISLVIAQRLVKKLCEVCKQSDRFLTENNLSLPLFQPIGCAACIAGYSSQIGLFESLVFASSSNQQQCIFMQQQALAYLKLGLITFNEVKDLFLHATTI